MKDNNKILKQIRNWIFSILGAFFIATLLNSKVFAMAQVQQSSMENTLFNNQRLIVDKLSYNFQKPKRGDIIIFLENEEKGTIFDEALRNINNITSKFNSNNCDNAKDTRLVKRIIGVEGDEIDINDGYVYLNGEKLDEPYVKGETMTKQIKFPIKVGKNKIFVLGDNRIVSRDSREFGVIDCNQVEGKVVYRVYPFNYIGGVK